MKNLSTLRLASLLALSSLVVACGADASYEPDADDEITAEIGSEAVFGSDNRVNLTDMSALVASWPLNVVTPAGTTPDIPGHAHDGAVVGASLVQGRLGKALQLGPGKYVDVPSDPALEPERLTVEAWVKADGRTQALPSVSYVLGKGSYACKWASYALYADYFGGLTFYIGTSSGYVNSPDAGSGIWDDRWHHVAGIYDGAFVRLFVDGVEVGSGTPVSEPIAYSLGDVAHDLFIGRYGLPCVADFPGAVDEVRLWNRPLTAAELALHASHGG